MTHSTLQRNSALGGMGGGIAIDADGLFQQVCVWGCVCARACACV
jgi:hypothetical protein